MVVLLYEGGTVFATVTFRDSDGQLIDPTSVTFVVRSPSGVTTEYQYDIDEEVVHPSVGVFRLRFVPDRENRWLIVATGIRETSDGEERVVAHDYIDVSSTS